MSKKKKSRKRLSFDYKKFIPSFKPLAVLNYILLMAVSVVLVLITIIALPMTEDFYPDISLNLQQKVYTNKSYILELKVKTQDEEKLEKKIEQTKSILTKRLYDVGVEQVSVTGHHLENPTPDDEQYLYRYIQVKVRTTVPEIEVDQVVRSRNYLRFYSLKEDFDYDNESDPTAQYQIANYNPSGVTRHDFRNIYFKELLDSNEEMTYFALFKAAAFNSEFKEFAKENAGKNVGVAIDGLIAQVPMPLEFSPSYQEALQASGQPVRPQFALGITQDPRDAHISGVLFNSGVIPLEYNVVGQEPISSEDPVQQPTYFATVLLAALILYAYFTGKQDDLEGGRIFRNFFEIILLLTVWLAYLKFLAIPVDINILILETIVLLFFAHELQAPQDHHQTRIVVFILGTLLLTFVGFGQVGRFGLDMTTLMIGLIVSRELSNYYLDNIRDYLRND